MKKPVSASQTDSSASSANKAIEKSNEDTKQVVHHTP